MVLALVPCVHMRNPLLPCQNMIFNPTSSWVELHKKEKYCRTLSHNDLVCYASIIPDISSLMFIWFMGGKYWTMEISLIAPFLSFRRCFNSSFPYITSFENPPCLVEPVLKEVNFRFEREAIDLLDQGYLLDLGDLKTLIRAASLYWGSIPP